MNPATVGVVGLGIMFILLMMGIPVAVIMLAVGFFGFMLLGGTQAASQMLGMIPYSTVASYSLTVVPLFIIMGYFAAYAGFATDIFDAIEKWVGHFTGGLVHATILGGAAFAAVCGSGMASCATLASVCLPECLRLGVNRKMALGAVAAAGTLASMIPPSVLMVIYGVITQQSIGRLLIAGIFPGLLSASLYMISVYIRVRRNPSLAPPLSTHFTWKERLVSLKGVWGIGLISLLIIVGIYSGIFTPTEAGGIGAFGALLLGLLSRRLKWPDFRSSIESTIKTTSSVFFVLVGAFVFAKFLAITGIPMKLSNVMTSASVSPMAVILMIMVLYLIMGTFIDMVAAMFITLPILYPAVIAAGHDPIWFGVLIVKTCEIALISPPFALNLFVLKGVVPDSTLKEIIQGVVPYLMVDLLCLSLYIAFPQIALFLPSRMMK